MRFDLRIVRGRCRLRESCMTYDYKVAAVKAAAVVALSSYS